MLADMFYELNPKRLILHDVRLSKVRRTGCVCAMNPAGKKIVVLVEGCSCVKTNKPVRHFRNACARREENEICMALNKGMIMILISLHCVPSFKFHEFYILSRRARACISEITTNLAALSDRPRSARADDSRTKTHKNQAALSIDRAWKKLAKREHKNTFKVNL